MNIQSFVILLTLLTLLVVRADDRPNFIVIMADDLGYADLGFTGSTEIETPILDRLANEGVIFKNGYVTHPYCGPSRAGFITGRYQARFGVEINFTNSFFDVHQGLPLTEKTFGKRLKAAGYRTGIIGKWHLGGSHPYHPNNRGFDYFYGFLSGGHTYFPENVTTLYPLHLENGNPHYSANEGGYWPLMRNDRAAEFDEYLTTALSRDAARFVEFSDKPFALFLAYNAPHGPLEAPKGLIEKYAHIENGQRRIYAAMIDAMDQGIGMVVDALERSDKLDNTLIFFLSDNGGIVDKAREHLAPRGENKDWGDNGNFRGGKGSMLEGGSHVPFIAHWPKGIEAGSVFEYPVSSLDIAATFVALGNGDTGGPELEGVNLIPYVQGKVEGAPHEALFWRMQDGVQWAVRTPSAKFLLPRTMVGSEPMLFDMVNDPYESKDIVDERPELRQQLAALWNEWNSKNTSNKYLQAGSYQKARLRFYNELREKLDQDAAKKELLVIE
ncbi:MAG: sulfatase [Lentimonas sp.]